MHKSPDKISTVPCNSAELPPELFNLNAGIRSNMPDNSLLFTAAPDTRRIILTGAVQSGKSTLAALLVRQLKRKNIHVAGILAKGLWENNQRSGFDLIDLKTGLSMPLARRLAPAEGLGKPEMPFRFLKTGVAAGRRALNVVQCGRADLIMVDEIGKLEARGLGWAPDLAPLLAFSEAIHLWIVREHLVEKICRIWHVTRTQVIHVTAPDALEQLTAACATGKIE